MHIPLKSQEAITLPHDATTKKNKVPQHENKFPAL
jgi:hypothetical protein